MATATATRKNGRANGAPEGEKSAGNGSTSQRRLLAALHAFRQGDFSVRIPVKGDGIEAEIARAFNEVAETKSRMLSEVKRVSKLISREGRLSQRAVLEHAAGGWQEHIDAYNTLIESMTAAMAETNRVIGSVAEGDLSQRMTLDIEGRPLRGDFLRSSRTINTMVDQLNAFASEVTRVAREVGSEGKLGGQAQV